jgi:hypothetical protein
MTGGSAAEALGEEVERGPAILVERQDSTIDYGVARQFRQGPLQYRETGA